MATAPALWPDVTIGNGCALHTFTWTITLGSSVHDEPTRVITALLRASD